MEKALKILNRLKEQIVDTYEEPYNVEISYTECFENDIRQAIAELEEAMKPKTCEDCKGFVRNDYCHIIDDDCRVVMERCNGCKQFEPKDNE